MSAFDAARQLADTVLFEGYMLYPYRATDAKNRVRWQFGVLAPPGFTDIDPSERSHLQVDCLVDGQPSRVTVRVRFLQVQRRSVEAMTADGFAPVAALDLGDTTYLPWDEAVVQEIDVEVTLAGATERLLHVSGGTAVEELRGSDGVVAGRLVRRRARLDAVLRSEVDTLPGPYGTRRLRLRLDNRTSWVRPAPGTPDRQDALSRALVAAHLLLSVSGGAFLSQLDPPQWATGYLADCEHIGCYPVLAGEPGHGDLLLAAPIILYDHPQVAPESAVVFCDSTEMDEMLTLRTLTLTEQEKREARGSDPRAAAMLDQVEHLPPELMDRLHGAIRSMTSTARRTDDRPAAAPSPETAIEPPWWDPVQDAAFSPDTDSLLIGDVSVSRGHRVRLRPGAHRADAQDMFLAGRTATVAGVFFDVDGGSHLAVTIDDNAAEDFVNPHGRFLYFSPDEVDPLGVSA